MAAELAPPFPYYGGKTTLASRIVDVLPEHGHYVEPFAGSLAVLLAKPRARMETVNDLDGNLMTFWRVLRDRPGDLMRVCALTPHSRAEQRAAYDLAVDDELEQARRVWVCLTQGRGGSLRVAGWRHYQDPGSRATSMPDYLAGYVDRMRDAAARLAGVSLEARGALEVVADYGKHREVLIYADPPYVRSTRSSRQYAVEMSDDGEHRALADVLRSCRASVVLSGYASALYDDELYADWHRTEFATYTGQGNHKANGADRRTEVLWSNRPLGRCHLFAADW